MAGETIAILVRCLIRNVDKWSDFSTITVEKSDFSFRLIVENVDKLSTFFVDKSGLFLFFKAIVDSCGNVDKLSTVIVDNPTRRIRAVESVDNLSTFCVDKLFSSIFQKNIVDNFRAGVVFRFPRFSHY